MMNMKFDAEVVKVIKKDDRLYVITEKPIYEIKVNKNGILYKKCLSNKKGFNRKKLKEHLKGSQHDEYAITSNN